MPSLRTYNPETMPKPPSLCEECGHLVYPGHTGTAVYSQIVEIPAGARVVFFAGQTPISPADGTVPQGFVAQHRLIWENTIAGLHAVGMGVEDIVKINVYATTASDVQYLPAERAKFLGGHAPASTWAVVAALAQPHWVVEQEIVAAKVD